MLALDTATPAITVALHDGERVLVESTTVDPRRHGELLAPGIVHVLAEARRSPSDLTAVVVGVGPGPFTGLRVGLVTARALGDALSVPVYGACTLDVLAFASGLDGPFAVATDARRKEVYWARYADPRTRVTDPGVDRPQNVSEQVAGLPVVGHGARLYPDAFSLVHPPEYPSAGALATLAAECLAANPEAADHELAAGGSDQDGRAHEAADGPSAGQRRADERAAGRPAALLAPMPLYLRRPDAVEPGPRKQALPA